MKYQYKLNNEILFETDNVMDFFEYISIKLKALRHKDNTSNTNAKTVLFINGLHTFNKQNGFVTEKQYFYIVKLYNSLIENR